MALSFEESKKLLAEQAAAAAMPAVMSLSNEDTGIMTLESGDETGLIVAYNEWTKSDKYDWYDEYTDDRTSTIDKNKNITVDASQINISQEENSQFIPFEMPRYYDGFDLVGNGTEIWIYYLTSDGYVGASRAINVSYDTATIKFGWLIDGSATHIAGNLKFEIRVTGANSKGNAYVWKSKTFEKMNVLQSLIDDRVIELDDSWVQELVTKVAESVGEKIADANLSGYATETYVQEQIAAIPTPDVSGQISDHNTSSDAHNDIRSLIDAINIPTKISEFENDSGYLTEIPSEFVTETELNEKGYLTEVPAEYITETELDAKGYLTTIPDDYVTGDELQTAIGEIDVSDQLGDLGTNEDGSIKTVVQYVNEAVEAVDVSDQLGDLTDEEGNERTVKQYVDDSVAAVDVSDQLADYAKNADVKTKTDELASSISTNTSSITSLNKTVEEINTTLAGIDKSPRVTYEATYGDVEMDDGSTAEYMFTLWEKEGTNEPTVKSRFQIMGGGGSTGSSVVLRIAYVEGYTTPITATASDSVIIKYDFSGEDSAGDTNLDGTASWKVGNRVVATQDVATGICEFDLTEYVNIGDNKVVLTITHATGAVATKAWTIKVVDIKIESSFDDTKTNEANEPVNFTFTPYGGVEKTVHFLLDGEEIATKTSSAAASGLSDSYAIPAQAHGTHLFEAYITAEISGKTIGLEEIIDEESGEVVGYNHTISIVKDIIWYDETSDVPVISCVSQDFTARQYEATNITYTVYDPSTETPSVTLKSTYVNEDGETVEEFSSNIILPSNTDIWQYKTDVVGEHTLTITCGETVKTLKATIVELGINVTPITAGLVFDFNPVGRSNNDENKLWSYGDSGIGMTVSDNFDWVNGGYQIDANGDQCFCIKAGTTAEINYELFGDDAKSSGKQFKLIFKTENVAEPDTTFLSCVSNTTDSDHVGIEMNAHEATIYAKTASLPLPYAEEEVIEFEFNITADSAIPSMVMGYEDGVSTRPLVYDSTHNFQQHKDHRKTISLGSNDCDLYIYRFKVYNTSLSDRDILNNFIADARSAEEMVSRYNRNQIYKDGILTPEYLAEVCPQLHIIKIETPYFTSDKDEKIGRVTSEQTGEVLMTNVECIYKGGDPILDNWVATDVVHSGQGTSSNNYGPAGRNLDIIMKRYKDKKTEQYLNESPIITLSDGTEVSKVALTRNSVDVNYFNIKVNIASSENANNALLAKRYNQYNPYLRPIVRQADTLEDHYTSEEIAAMTEDQKSSILAGYQAEAIKRASYVKDTMEFQNCVIFVKESDPNLSTHREFNDNNWHFYAIGNIGDSKKTDDTRLTDPTDPYECILEVMDNTLPNSTMPTGKVDESGAPVYPIDPSEWIEGNSAYDSLHSDLFDESKATDKENGLADTYGWRYIYEDGTDEENAEAKAYVEQKWKEFYGFVVTATDEEFKAHLGDYCVLNSVMYYYLFTLRYTMTDNHAKNSFWHYGKTGEIDEDGNPIRKWDLCFDYDNDTALGIDNYGRMTYRYGYEEIDYVDGTSDWVWNAPQHVFFLRLRELFDEELSALYNVLPADCWSATSLINQFNDWQMQFPEELWRLDIERKYIRTYTGSYINGPAYPEFLTERANGRKKTQRAQFEKSQEKYMASKFSSTVAASDDIILRCSVPNTTLAVPANFDMHLIPYAYMYLNVKYNTSPPIKIRAIPNKEYTIEYDGDVADIIEIYSASCLKSVGDLSACYLTNGTFANATKISELVLGNDTDGYNNTNVMTLGLGSNGLLKKLNIQNMSGLTHSLDLSGLKNLEELYAFGSGTSGIIFADGGNIEIAQIPDVGALQMKNLSYLDDDGFEPTSSNNLSRLVAENSLLDLIELINNSPNLYQVRLTGIDWTLEDTTLLERLYDLAGVTNTGGNADKSIVAGKVHVPVIREQQLYEYKSAWPDLEITYNTLITQYAVTFINTDGTVLDIQYVDEGSKPVDPTTRDENPIETPTQESTASTNYTFAGWDSDFVAIFENTTIKATYTGTIREYIIKYVSNETVLQESTAPYGSTVLYSGDTPTYTAEETGYRYYLFDGWDQFGYVDGDKTINAIYDSCKYSAGYFDDKDLSTMRPVEIYAMIKLKEAGVNFNIQDYVALQDTISITLGNDVSYPDVEEKVLISEEVVFTGNNYVDTGEQIFKEDRDFVLAIDYSMSSSNTVGNTLAQCFSANESSGFTLVYNNGVNLNWGNSTTSPSVVDNREIVVLRHVKGENGVHVYSSNTAGLESSYIELSGVHSMVHDNTLVFGCNKTTGGDYKNYATGSIYWSKVWYVDLGDEMCSQLVAWPRETIDFEMCGFGLYYLANSSKTCSMAFLASDPLSKKMQLNSSSSTSGGWASYSLNNYLNERIYDAFPVNWKQLMKQVNVKSSIGNKSTEIATSACYVFIPCAYELNSTNSTFNAIPYYNEVTDFNCITYLYNDDSLRILYDKDGTAVPYWTRSPNASYTNYIYIVEADGELRGFVYPNAEYSVRIMFSI